LGTIEEYHPFIKDCVQLARLRVPSQGYGDHLNGNYGGDLR
jgi:hypothetical protein